MVQSYENLRFDSLTGGLELAGKKYPTLPFALVDLFADKADITSELNLISKFRASLPKFDYSFFNRVSPVAIADDERLKSQAKNADFFINSLSINNGRETKVIESTLQGKLGNIHSWSADGSDRLMAQAEIANSWLYLLSKNVTKAELSPIIRVAAETLVEEKRLYQAKDVLAQLATRTDNYNVMTIMEVLKSVMNLVSLGNVQGAPYRQIAAKLKLLFVGENGDTETVIKSLVGVDFPDLKAKSLNIKKLVNKIPDTDKIKRVLGESLNILKDY